MIKEPTASTFVFCRDPGGHWRTALVWHPRLECWLPAGGHVEDDETPAETAVRETLEETGLQVRLLPGPATSLPSGFPHEPVPAPWWITEMRAAPDNHTGQPHAHIDHVFLAVTTVPQPVAAPAHQVRWFTADELTVAASAISEDSRLQAAELFRHLSTRTFPAGTAPARDGTGAATGSRGFTTLIVLRGNSASGKSSVAAAIRARYGRGIAIVAQDNLRRTVLRERDVPHAANITLIGQVARFALDAGFHVIVEGILYAAHYGAMLQQLKDAHQGPSYFYYLDVPLEETLRRHQGKPQAAEYGRAEMSQWYRDKDLLPGTIEEIIPADSQLDETVQRILNDAGLVPRLDA